MGGTSGPLKIPVKTVFSPTPKSFFRRRFVKALYSLLKGLPTTQSISIRQPPVLRVLIISEAMAAARFSSVN
jgi:hypothetical protein